MAVIKKNIRDEIAIQVKSELEFARKYKLQRTSSWQKNEEMYYGKKRKTDSERANVQLGKMQEFVHTLLSKIDTPLIFKFGKKKQSDLMKAERANALRRVDSNDGDWDMKDLLGKKQAVIYGRAIYTYHADSYKGFYTSTLENVDVYDFFIDPAAGGLDIENAMYLGRGNVVKLANELEQGIKDKIYLRDETKQLVESGGNASEINREETQKQVRRTVNDGQTQKEIGHNDKYKLHEWWTTYKGERYYVLFEESSGLAIRVEKWEDLDDSNLYPFWTWAAYPDLTEFWTPSYCDYVREIFMAQSVSINQMLDNAEQINKPQRAIDSNAIVNKSELKYKKSGWIRMRGGDDINKKFKILETPSIKTPIDVYQLLEVIGEKNSGVTASAKGVAEEEKVTIYKGNLQAVNDRFNFLNKSYSHGYKRFAKLYYNGIKQHLKKKVAVELIGSEGVQVEEVSKKDITPAKGRDFEIIVESSNSEFEVSFAEKQAKEQYLLSVTNNPAVNQRKLLEMRGQIAGFKEEELGDLFDIEGTGDARLMAEADRDLELLLEGKTPKQNLKANVAYKRRFVDYMESNSEYLDDEQFAQIVDYIRSIDDVILANTIRKAKELNNARSIEQASMGEDPSQTQTNGAIKPPKPLVSENVGGINQSTNL